jgi:hypothetical protein
VNIIVVYKKAWRIIFELYEHINYFPIAQIYKLFLGISYVFLMSYVHCEQALTVASWIFYIVNGRKINSLPGNILTKIVHKSNFK